jgi:hypothetical protein
MAREAEMMCAWMIKNNKPIDFCDFVPREIVDSHIVRFETLNVMINILEESCSAAAAAAWHKIDKEGPASRNGPGGDGDGVIADGAANTIGYGCSILFFFADATLCGFERILLDDKHCDTIRFIVLSPGVEFQMY